MYPQHSARKFAQPNIPSATLSRASLIKTLQDIIAFPFIQTQAAQYKLILISAPAGYGKTTLLADFAQHTTIACCWYIIEETDDNPCLFLEFLVESIRQKIPHFGSMLDSQFVSMKAHCGSSVLTHQLESCVDALALALTTEISETLVLFLCNYHEINANDKINTLVNRLLRLLPPHVIIVIESRAIPDLEIVSLAAQRQVYGLGSSELRFTAEEIQDFAQLQGGAQLSEEEADQIVTSFEGWITGILLGTRLGGMLFPSAVDADMQNIYHNRQHLLAYFKNDVFKHKTEIYTFLKKMSIFQQMTPYLCNNLLHINDADIRLSYIERQGLFISQSHGGKPQVYTCHTALRELLYTEFYQQDPQAVLSLHQEAATLFLSSMDFDQAISHAFSAHAYTMACTLLENVARQMLCQNRTETLLGWINLLPKSIIEQSARLLLTQTVIYTTQCETVKSLPLLYKAQELLERTTGNVPQKELPLFAEILLAQADAFLGSGNYQQALQKCSDVLTFLPDDERELRARAHLCFGICANLLGDFYTGIAQMQQSLHLWEHNAEIMQTALVHGNLADAYNMLGNYALSEHHRERAIASCERLGNQQGTLHNLIGMATTKWNKGDLESAEATLNQALITARQAQLQSCEAHALEHLGEMYLEQQHFNKVLTLTEDALVLAHRMGDHYLVNSILCTQALAYLFMGDPSTATLLIDQIDVKEGDTVSYIGALREMTRGTIYLLQKHYQEAEHCLKLAEISLGTTGLKRLHLRTLIRLAACHVFLKQRVEAIQSLEKAVSLATEEFYEHIIQFELNRFPDLARAIQTFPEEARFPSIQLSLPEAQEIQEAQPERVSVQSKGAEQSTRLRVLAFGEPSIQIDGVAITSWRMARAMELFFLLLDKKNAVHKEQIIEMLWPDIDSQADQTLRSAIFYLRKAIGASSVIHRNKSYLLDLPAQYEDDIWYDVAIF